jgi:ATP-dependent Clp protease ATP-binding subunit ClpA
MFERFTAPARAAVVNAQQQARDLGHPFIGTEHLLLAMLAGADGPVTRLLADGGVDAASARAEIRRLVGEPDLSFVDTDSEDAAALKAIGIDVAAVRAAIEESFGADALRLPRPVRKRRGLFGLFSATTYYLPFTRRTKKVLGLSLREALQLGHDYIAPEHILLGMLRDGGGLAVKVIADKGVDFDALRAGLTRSLGEKAA